MTATGPAEAQVAAHPDAGFVREYLASLAHQRRLAPISITNYARSLARLLTLLAAARLDALEDRDVRRFVARLHAEGLSPRALANLPSSL